MELHAELGAINNTTVLLTALLGELGDADLFQLDGRLSDDLAAESLFTNLRDDRVAFAFNCAACSTSITIASFYGHRET